MEHQRGEDEAKVLDPLKWHGCVYGYGYGFGIGGQINRPHYRTGQG